MAARARERLTEAVDHQGAVRQAGERVVQRPVFERLLGRAPIGDIAHVRHDALHRGLVQKVRRQHLEPTPVAVGVPAADFDLVLARWIADDGFEVRGTHRPVLGVNEVQKPTTDEIARSVTEDVFDRGADVRRARVPRRRR